MMLAVRGPGGVGEGACRRRRERNEQEIKMRKSKMKSIKAERAEREGRVGGEGRGICNHRRYLAARPSEVYLSRTLSE